MSKALFSYTTEIAVLKTVAEIEAMLVRAGASAIVKDYDPQGNIHSLSFRIKTEFGLTSLLIPARAEESLLVLRQQAKDKKIPQRFAEPAQAARVAWRVVYHFLEAALAMIQVRNAKFEQLMLPYMQFDNGETVYELLHDKGFNLEGRPLALPAPEK